jgi:hypothetical protein
MAQIFVTFPMVCNQGGVFINDEIKLKYKLKINKHTCWNLNKNRKYYANTHKQKLKITEKGKRKEN